MIWGIMVLGLVIYGLIILKDRGDLEMDYSRKIIEELNRKELSFCDCFLDWDLVNGEYVFDFMPIFESEKYKQMFGDNLNGELIKVYMFRNGYWIKTESVGLRKPEIRIEKEKNNNQYDYSFYLANGDQILTTKLPLLLGELNNSQLNKVKYVSYLDKKNADEFDFAENLRQKLLNNLVFVIKKESESWGRVVEVKLVRYDKDQLKAELFFEKNGQRKTKKEVNISNPWVWIKVDEGFSKNAYLWDETFLAWFILEVEMELAKSSLDFWYSLQVDDGLEAGLIPREIRLERYADGLTRLKAGEGFINELSFLPLESTGVNSPFFMSRVELDIYELIRNKQRLKEVLPKLIKYYEWVESRRRVELINKEGKKVVGYRWSGHGSGMDNAPRCQDDESQCVYSDLIAQQAALAGDISEIAQILKEKELYQKYQGKSKELKVQIRSYYYDKGDGFVYDLDKNGKMIKGNQTIAFVWSLYAQVFEKEEVKVIVERYLFKENKFGGLPPIPSVARDSSDYDEEGGYWRGGVWPPMVWISYLALKNNGYEMEAMRLAEDYWQMAKKSWNIYKTVYEYYQPKLVGERFGLEPGRYPEARSDFYGWGVLPLKLAVELERMSIY